MDLRSRVAFAEGHVSGSFNFEGAGKLATYLAWLIPWGKPVTLLAETPAEIADAQRELARVGIDRPAAATGDPLTWIREGERLAAFPRARFADLADVYGRGEDAYERGEDAEDAEKVVVLDVRRDAERAEGFIEGSAHIPVHELHGRLGEVPDGTVWVHCAGGMRAAIAASLLDATGRKVVAVDDGFEAAAEAGLSITRP